MIQRRTDLALEAHALWRERAEDTSALPGVRCREEERAGCPITRVDILDRRGAEALGKPEGHYVTVDLSALSRREEDSFARSVEAVADELRGLMGDLPPSAPVLVAGLGNRAITPDAVGPRTADLTLVTRHLTDDPLFASFRPVAALAAGPMGTTGLESGELIRAAAERIQPALVIAVDALVSRSLERLGRTVQLSDTGIAPGSGVGNHRAPLDRDTLGVPVIAVGAPTVVEAATLCADVLVQAGREDLDPEALRGAAAGMIVAPRETDRQTADLSRVLGYAITLALQPGLSLRDVEMRVDG